MSRRGGRGKKSHKGQRRHFTSEEEMKAELERNEREKEWRAKKGLGSDDEEDEKSEKPDLPPVKESSSGEESDSDEEEGKPKGVSGLIAISNPNRLPEREKKAKAEGKVELSRREREELEKQQHHLRMLKLQDEGKTEKAKEDLARLAIIKKQREEAAKKREQEKKAKEAVTKKK